MTFIADYYPPGLEPETDLREETGSRGFAFSRRALDPETLRAVALGLRERAPAARALRAGWVLRALGRVHAQWARPRSPLRAEAVPLLHRATGYPPRVLDEALRGLFAGLSSSEMEAWLAAAGIQPGSPDTSAIERRTLVNGPALTLVVASGNIPGAAIPSLAQALLLRSPCLVKTSAAEPVLLPLYARSIAEIAPELGALLAVTGWAGGRRELEDPLLGEVDAVVAYGGDEALADLRARLPTRARLLGYGHRISFSAVAKQLLSPRRSARTAELAARDFALFDQQGCLSPQAIYVERGRGVSPELFAEHLAGALEALERIIPRRLLDAGEAAAIHQYRASVEMRALGDERVRLRSSPGGTAWTVVLDPDPELAPCCLNRTAIVRPIDDLEELPLRIARWGPALISAALGAPPVRVAALAPLLAAAGVTRICPLGQAQDPQSALHHDGVNAVGALARYTVLEEPGPALTRER